MAAVRKNRGMVLSLAQKESLMQEALAEADRGMAEGEVPIGAVLARYCGGEVHVVSRGHNRVNRLQRKVAHAEMMAFENASGDGCGPSRLPLDADDAILVSTLEPCVMCLGAAMEAGVRLVLFGLAAPADGGTNRIRPPYSPESHVPAILGDILAAESRHRFVHWLKGNECAAQAPFVKQLLSGEAIHGPAGDSENMGPKNAFPGGPPKRLSL